MLENRMVSGIIMAMIVTLMSGALIGSACSGAGLATIPHEYELPHAWCYVMGNGQGVACVPK